MLGDVKMQTIKRRTGRSLTGDRPLFLALTSQFQGDRLTIVLPRKILVINRSLD